MLLEGLPVFSLCSHLLSPFNSPSCFHPFANTFFELEQHFSIVLNLWTFAPGLGDPTGHFLNPRVAFLCLGDESWSQNLLGRGTGLFAFTFSGFVCRVIVGAVSVPGLGQAEAEPRRASKS